MFRKLFTRKRQPSVAETLAALTAQTDALLADTQRKLDAPRTTNLGA